MSEANQQYIYLLRLISRLLNEDDWTANEIAIVERHFAWLKQLEKAGKLILAGRTLNSDASRFGIVILNVDTDDQARQLMENDPAVKEGIMTAELYPYKIALLAEKNLG